MLKSSIWFGLKLLPKTSCHKNVSLLRKPHACVTDSVRFTCKIQSPLYLGAKRSNRNLVLGQCCALHVSVLTFFRESELSQKIYVRPKHAKYFLTQYYIASNIRVFHLAFTIS